MIDLGSMRGKGKRFMTIEFGTLGSALAGRVRATNLLYCDDLVDGIEAAMSRDRMDKLWQQYYTDLRQRKIGDRVKELHIATRWSVHDVLGRLEQEYEGDPYQWRSPNQKEFALMLSEMEDLTDHQYGTRTRFSGDDSHSYENYNYKWTWHDTPGFWSEHGRINVGRNGLESGVRLRCVRDTE